MRHSLNLIRTTLRGLYAQGEIECFIGMIFEKLCGMDRVQLILHKDTILSDDEHKKIETIARRLSQYEPIQYVLGEAYFCGLRLQVGSGVLVPRPETEELVRLIAGRHKADKGLRIADYCTGSGCIAIALATLLPDARVTAWDISPTAIEYARRNAEACHTQVTVGERDVLCYEPRKQGEYDIVVSNPPYVCDSERSDMERNVLDYEPHQALFVPDDDPLRFYRAIARIARTELTDGGALYFEINCRMGDACRHLLQEMGYRDIEIHNDDNGLPRMVAALK